jgi:molybdenum cofactor cytidylyltransferase
MVAPSGAPVAIVLAAGRSERMGKNKLLEVIDGKTMIERTLASFTGSTRVNDVVLVVPAADAEQYAWIRSVRVHLVENPTPEKGMISSIRAGLTSTWAQERDFLLHPADVPFVTPEIVDRIVREFSIRGAKILLPAYKGLGGHPGMYAASLRQEFFAHGEQNGAREVLVRHRDQTFRLNVHDPDVCFDVDTPEDLRIAADAGARWARVEQLVEERKGGRAR